MTKHPSKREPEGTLAPLEPSRRGHSPDDTYGLGLEHKILQLREALGASPDSPRFMDRLQAKAGRDQGGDLALDPAGRPLAAVQLKRRTGSQEEAREAAAYGTSDVAERLPHLERIQAAFGSHDVSNVQAHVGGRAAEATAAMGAIGYATGAHVAFHAEPDLHLAAHEAAHVVQQRQGVQLSGGMGRAGDAHERHADAVADLVVAGKSAQELLDRSSSGQSVVGSVQLQEDAARSGSTSRKGPSEASSVAVTKAAANLHVLLGIHESIFDAQMQALQEFQDGIPERETSDDVEAALAALTFILTVALGPLGAAIEAVLKRAFASAAEAQVGVIADGLASGLAAAHTSCLQDSILAGVDPSKERSAGGSAQKAYTNAQRQVILRARSAFRIEGPRALIGVSSEDLNQIVQSLAADTDVDEVRGVQFRAALDGWLRHEAASHKPRDARDLRSVIVAHLNLGYQTAPDQAAFSSIQLADAQPETLTALCQRDRIGDIDIEKRLVGSVSIPVSSATHDSTISRGSIHIVNSGSGLDLAGTDHVGMLWLQRSVGQSRTSDGMTPVDKPNYDQGAVMRAAAMLAARLDEITTKLLTGSS